MEKEEENPLPINEKEVMDYYGCTSKFDIFKLKIKFLRSWIYILLHIHLLIQDLQ